MNFVAQSLDNDAPMIVASGRVVFGEGDPRRRAVLDETSAASGRGVETPVTDKVIVYEHSGVFALKVYPPTKDAEGRQAPILGSVRVDQVGGEGWPEAALEDVAWFANAASRPLTDDLRQGVLAGLREIKKKAQRHRQTLRLVVVGSVVLVLLALAALLGWWMKQ